MGSLRDRREHDDEHDEAPAIRAAPGKRKAAEHDGESAAAWPAPVHAGRVRVDRWADGDVAESGLAAALGVIEDSRTSHTLPPELARRFEAELGIDVGGLRLHDDPRAHQAAELLKARAFTIGDDIYFAAGAYDPTSAAGIELIAHEIAHVAQQRRGTAPAGPRISQPGDPHEREADGFAQRFARGAAAAADPAELVNRTRRAGQRMALPFLPELEDRFGVPLDFVEAYTGDAARIACELMAASAFAVRNVVAFADPSPQRDVLMHELAHVMQMGGRSSLAPRAFVGGSLRIGDHDDTAEHDARAAAGGARVAAVSAPDVVRRATKGSKAADDKDDKTQPWSLEDAKQRFAEFANNLAKRKKGERHVFAKPDTETVRFLNTSKDIFRLREYKAAVQKISEYSELSDADLEKDLTEINTRANKVAHTGLVKVGSKEAKRWAWVDPVEKPGDHVVFLFEEFYKHAENWEKYNLYCEALEELKKKKKGGGELTHQPEVELPGGSPNEKAISKFSKVADGTAMKDPELKACRDALDKAILAEDNYKERDNQWEVFFKRVVQAEVKFPQAMVGEWFGEIVKRDLGAKGKKVNTTQIVFEADELPNDFNHRGDGTLAEGNQLKVMEFKTGPKSPGDGDEGEDGSKFISQATGYARIVRSSQEDQPIMGVRVKETKQVGPFRECVYVFPTTEMARKWAPELHKAFKNEGVADALKIYPPVTDDDGKLLYATIQFNPEFKVPLDKDKTRHRINNPPIIHPGVNFKQIDVTTKAKGSNQIASGDITFDLDLQGGIKAKGVNKTIKPDAGVAKVENEKFKGLQSALDKVFKGRVTADASLVPGGVKATLTLKEGASGIPNLTVKGGVEVSYINGKMSAEGTIELANGKKSLHGKATVSWDGGEFGFKGEATLEPGMVDGLGRVTGTVEYAQGGWKFGIREASYEKTFKAITLTGKAFGLEYDTRTGGFSGLLELDADLGMFGKATATAELKNNKLKKAVLSYDSPELKYPAKSDKPGFKGTAGGTLTYSDGKFSGAIRGTANINLPALKAVAGEGGVGLAVDADVHDDGSYSGTVRTTSPLKFGKHIEVPRVSCTLAKDGSLSGSFEIRIVKIKYLTEARIKCTVTKDGLEVEDARLEVPFGNQDKGQFWGKLSAGYSKDKGLEIGGEVNYKIKEGMIATGTLKYSTETHEVSLEMKISEITLLDKTISKTLFKGGKQIPIVNIYGLGIYIDIGFELGFNFGFKLGLKPTVSFEGLSLDTWEFKQIAAKMELLGLIYAELVGTPKLGIGVFALDPSILRGGGGLKVPIVGRAEIKPTGTLGLSYSPKGDVTGEAKLGMAMTFGITGSVKPYAEFAVLNDLWNPKWEGEALTSFEILKPKELFNFQLDLTGDMTPKDAPPLPEENAAKDPTPATGDRKLEESKPEPTERGEGESKDAKANAAPKEGGDEGPFSLSSLMDKLKTIPGFETAQKIFKIAKKVWDVVKPIYDLVEPLFDLIGKRIEAFMDLFDTELPSSAGDILPWVWKLAKKVLNIAFGGLVDFAKAIIKMIGKVAGFVKKLINKAVAEGWIGVKRHSYYIWRPWPWDDYEFMAAAEYKVTIPGVIDLGRDGPPDILLSPSGAVSLCLYEALDMVGIPYTYVGNSDINRPYNDFWAGPGARG